MLASDFSQIARWIQQAGQDRILFVGWSEGAGLGLAATADAANQAIFTGLVVIGTPEQNILAWHWTDIGAEITKKLPHEPTFRSAEFMGKVSPLPLFVIASTTAIFVPLPKDLITAGHVLSGIVLLAALLLAWVLSAMGSK